MYQSGGRSMIVRENFEADFQHFGGQLEFRNICGPLVATVMEKRFDFKYFSLAIPCDSPKI